MSDVDDCYSYIYNTIIDLQNRCFPLVKLSRKKCSDKPWITPALKKSINTKLFLYKKFLLNKRESDLNAFKIYRNKLRVILSNAEKEYYASVLNFKLNKSKNIWHHLNCIVNRNKNKSNVNVSSLNTSSGVINDSESIANCFNMHFSKVGETLSMSIGNNTGNFQQYLNPSSSNSFFFENILPTEVYNTLCSLKNSKSPGPDLISSYVVKLSKDYICEPLCFLYNMSVLCGSFPSSLKISKVIPLFKKGNKHDVNNYRPITLSPIFSKVFEKIVFSRMIHFIESNNLLYEFQYGFRKGHSTTFALVDVIEMIHNNINDGKFVMGLFIDITKAFDSVQHDILLHKLYNYSFRGNIYNLLKSFLSNRFIYTSVNTCNSSLNSINCGVPQGSVLGPLLFLLYINDLPNCIPELSLKIFADDSNIFIINNDIIQLFARANRALSNIVSWCDCNKLVISYSKSCYMLFKPTVSSNNAIRLFDLNVSVNNILIERTLKFKYLGVWLDSNLNWKDHIDYLVSKLNSFIGLFYKNKDLLPYDCRKALYYSYIYPILCYGIELYGMANKTTLNKLSVSCNRIMRALQFVKKTTPSIELYRNFNTLPICCLYKSQILRTVYKCINTPCRVPNHFSKLFTFNSNVHRYCTRNANNIHLVNSYKGNSIIYEMSVLWNTLPDSLKSLLSEKIFANELKLYFLNGF